MNISERIVQIIGSVLEVDPDTIRQMSQDDSLSAIGMDSINCVDIVLTIEEELNVMFNDEELLLENLNSIGKLTELVERKLQENTVA